MRPVPLDQLRLFGWRHHLSALWWLGLLYRRPGEVRTALSVCSPFRSVEAGLRLHIHALPYVIVLCTLGRIVLFGVLGAPFRDTAGTLPAHGTWIAIGIAFGNALWILVAIAEGIAGSIARRIAHWIGHGIARGMTAGIAYWFARWLVAGSAFGIPFAIAAGISFGITGEIAEGIAFGISLGIAFGIGSATATEGIDKWAVVQIAGGTALCIAFGTILELTVWTTVWIASGIAFGIALMRAYYHVPQVLFVWPKVRGQWYPYHPVAWDDLCLLAFWRLDRLLVAYAELTPQAGEAEIERLIDHYPSQRMAALRARTILIARQAARAADFSTLDAVVARLPEGDKGFLKQTRRVRELVADISATHARLATMERPFLREPYTHQLVATMMQLRDRIAGMNEPLRTEFRAAATAWLKAAEDQLARIKACAAKEPTPQPFRAGDPVRRDHEAFVPRYGVVGELERQIMLSTGCPGIVLYGRRRTGKSTILGNLPFFLPSSVTVLPVSLLDPRAFGSTASFVGLLAQEIRGALRIEKAESETGGKLPTDLSTFFEFLSRCDQALEGDGKRLLISMDEYACIDERIGGGVFTEDLLATVRESIQKHRRLIWMFAGSREITELKHAPWISYLISVRTIELPMFTPEETRLLLTEPLKHSSLWEKNDPRRPRFDPRFWGEGGIERIHAQAGGWPHLVQLIAETIVDLVNDQGARAVGPDLFEEALSRAIVRGQNVLHELLVEESLLPGEWEYLAGFRNRETQAPPDDEAVYRSLRRRLLVAEDGGVWHLRVPLMARWLRERG